jgi:hypothetical protein
VTLTHNQKIAWRDDQVALLKREWANGKTAAEIVRLIGHGTRSAIIGKAHRLGLAGRSSPICRGGRPANSTKPAPKPKPVAEISPGVSAWQRQFWTPHREATLRQGYSAASVKSVGEIALRIGCSATSVMRWATRLGLSHPHSSHVSRKSAREKGVKAGPRLVHSATLAAQLPDKAPDSLDLPLVDLDRGQCHFPTSPHMASAHRHFFCGAPAERLADGTLHRYCAHHHAVTIRPMVSLEERATDNNAARMAAE